MPLITKGRIINITLLLITCAVMTLICETIFRARYSHYFYNANEQVQAIQSYLALHPKLGFTWRKNITPTEVILQNEDAQLDPLATDPNGFLNHPKALATNAHADIVGLGDSFMEHGHRTFYDFFEAQGLDYYSLAIHRQAPPQYNIILNDYAKPKAPKWILYGLYENDFLETEDFVAWRQSGLDWFAFHSGTWCGRSLNTSAIQRFGAKHLRGFGALAKVLREKAGIAPPSAKALASKDVTDHIREAAHAAAEHNARLLLVLIPSKETAIQGPTIESKLYDEVILGIADTNVEVLDLRPVFTQDEDPASLYYEVDGHWNRKGMNKAALSILSKIRDKGNGDDSDD